MKWSAVRRKLGRVDRAIDKSIASAEIPGAVAGARMPKNDETLEYFSERGFAVLQPERIPMARRTIFDLASLTKPIATTTAILLLVDEGAVELDAPVAKYLPLFSERGKEAVTIRNLLTHSAGLKPWRAYHEIFLQKERKTGESLIGTPEARTSVIDRTVRSALVHEPGEAAVYGDLDFIVLGAVVEATARYGRHLLHSDRARRAITARAHQAPHRRHRKLPLAGPHSLGRSSRPERVGHGWRGRARGSLLDDRR
ncbi:MAG: beta-lactamase family protein, partial [Deltaproteobacteria bacterium]|nr:beta-lactamase family protein [Deltaproteobacteria bacterium]